VPVLDIGERGVGERLDAGLERALEKVDGKIESGGTGANAREAGAGSRGVLLVAARLHDEIGLRIGAVDEHTPGGPQAAGPTSRRWWPST